MTTDPRGDCARRDDTLLLAYGALTPDHAVRARHHLDTCDVCRAEYADAVAVRAAYEATPAPSLTAQERERLLARATARAASRRVALGWRPLVAAATIALVFLAGRVTAPRGRGMHARLDALETELGAMRRDRLVAAVDDPSAVRRLQAVQAAASAVNDRAVRTVLLEVVAGDPNPNVRLAALDALAAMPLGEADRNLVSTLLFSEPSPLLRSALIDFLTTRGSEDRRPLLERVERSDDDPAVRAKARAALEGRT